MISTDVRRAPSGAPPATPWWLVAAGPAAVVVAVLAVLAAGGFSGAFAVPVGFPDPGVLARIGTPVATVLVELSLALTLGSLALAACVLGSESSVRRALGLAGAASATWAVLTVVQLVLRYSSISSTAVTEPTFGDQLGLFVTQVGLGRSYLVIIGVAALTSALALGVRSAVGAMWTLGVALVAVAAQASTGHAAGAASHELAVSTMFGHLTGAALWIGGLGTLAVVRVRGGLGRAELGAAVGRYSAIALWCYVVVGLSGVVNATVRVDSLADLLTDYGLLLLTKLLLLLALGVLGYLHRVRVVARLSGPTPQGSSGASGTTGKVAAAGKARAAGKAGAAGLFWRLVAVELAIMGAVSGVAVALASTAPPVADDVVLDDTPAEVVTGYPLPLEPSVVRWLTQWQWDVLAAFVCVAAVVVYLGWVRRVARSGERVGDRTGGRADRWPVGRTVAWCAAMVLALWATSGGPAMYGRSLFSAHLAQHVVLVAVVPVLLALAAPMTLLARAVPERTDGSRGPREWVLGAVGSRVGRFVANPVVATALLVVSVVAYLWTDLLTLGLTTYAAHLAVIAWFVWVGYLVANAMIGVDPGPVRGSAVRRLLLLLGLFVFWAVVGLVLSTSDVLLAPDWFGLQGRPWGPSAIADQQSAGVVAWALGELSVAVQAAIVLVRWLRQTEPTAAPVPPRAERVRREIPDRDGTAGRAAYETMLKRLERRHTANKPPNTP